MTSPAAILPAATLDDSGTAAVSADSPWLGLASFTEATRGFFFGREQETTELERRVQRKLLTVLFGKSGLGKTSILQAGLVPGLRARGYFPVYLRIDYGHDSPEPAEQIKQAINRAAAGRAGERGESSGAGAAAGEEAAARGTAAPAIDPGESIWEFLHHREVQQDSNVVRRDIGVVPQGSGTVPGDVSAETRTVKSAATRSAVTAPTATAPTTPPAATPHWPSAPPTPIPLLIFDQFEELFTLAQSDEFGRARAARFVEELADLVENRPPKALEAKLDTDDSLSERFDFSRSDYRVVISLREDYLAPLESLKKQMPSLSQNRLRLAPMTGSQALEAVLLPGQRLAQDPVPLPGERLGAGAAQAPGGWLEADAAKLPGRPSGAGRALVSQEVAEAIVRFVAGGAELVNAEVEPSLLSLICRELNEQRLAQHHSEISLGLLAGSRESILGSFYERALADQPAAVRRLIEDELLTESGYRENLAEESLLRKLQAAGAAPDALATLVNRRLLRIEERLDVRRVELTHDVLTGVVKASRDQRHEREAREATERLLAEQAARETAARRALRRARAIAAGCTVLAAAAVVAAVLAVINVQRARHAEADARQTHAISEQARGQAEGLLAFLTDDFVRELETFGRYQTIADLSRREIDYFEALPPQLQDPASIRNGALALVNSAGALQQLGDLDPARKNAEEAVALLQQLRRRGDASDPTAILLARADARLGGVLASQMSPEEAGEVRQARELLRPIAERPGASVEARRAYAEVLTTALVEDWVDNQHEDAVPAAREAMRLLAQLGARRHLDLTLDAGYADAESWLVRMLPSPGHDAEVRQAAEDAVSVADQVLAQRPQYGEALAAREAALGYVATDALNPAEALRFELQAMQTGQTLLQLEPKNTGYGNRLGIDYANVSQTLWSLGRLRESISYGLRAAQTWNQAMAGGFAPLFNLADVMSTVASEQAQIGDAAGAAVTVADLDGFTTAARLHTLGLAGGFMQSFVAAVRTYPAASLAYEHDDFAAARRISRDVLAQLQSLSPSGALQTVSRDGPRCRFSDLEGRAEYALGAFASAEQAERRALQACKASNPFGGGDARSLAQVSTWLSMALAAQGRRAEAARTIGPVVAEYRDLAKRNHGDQWLPLEFASALYAQSLTDGSPRPALLREAAALVAHLAPGIAALHDTRAWRARIQKAQQASTGRRPN